MQLALSQAGSPENGKRPPKWKRIFFFWKTIVFRFHVDFWVLIRFSSIRASRHSWLINHFFVLYVVFQLVVRHFATIYFFCEDIWMLEVWKRWRCVKHEHSYLYIYILYVYISTYHHCPLDGLAAHHVSQLPGYRFLLKTCLHLQVLYTNQCVPLSMWEWWKTWHVFLLFFFLIGHHLPAFWNSPKPSSFPHFRWAKDEIIFFRRNSKVKLTKVQRCSQFVLVVTKRWVFWIYVGQ